MIALSREQINQATEAISRLRAIRQRIDAAVSPNGQATDIIVLRLTKEEAAMIYVLVEGALP